MKKTALFFVVLICFLLPTAVFAEGRRDRSAAVTGVETVPTRPVRLIVPYAAGGGTDLIARMIALRLESIIGQPVPIINIGGAGGGLGMEDLRTSPADGYTMGIDIINIWTRKAMGTSGFGPEAFELLAQCGSFYLVQATRNASPFNTMQELFAEARRQPDTIQEATNIGAITHFTILSLMDATNSNLRLVHIGDGAQRITAVLGGHVETTLMGTHEVLPFYQAGEMRVLGVTSRNRLPALPGVPTAVEQGLDVVQPVGFWFFMPKGTPANRVNFMTDALERVMRDPYIINRMRDLAMDTTFLRGTEFARHVEVQGRTIMSIAERHNLGR